MSVIMRGQHQPGILAHPTNFSSSAYVVGNGPSSSSTIFPLIKQEPIENAVDYSRASFTTANDGQRHQSTGGTGRESEHGGSSGLATTGEVAALTTSAARTPRPASSKKR